MIIYRNMPSQDYFPGSPQKGSLAANYFVLVKFCRSFPDWIVKTTQTLILRRNLAFQDYNLGLRTKRLCGCIWLRFPHYQILSTLLKFWSARNILSYYSLWRHSNFLGLKKCGDTRTKLWIQDRNTTTKSSSTNKWESWKTNWEKWSMKWWELSYKCYKYVIPHLCPHPGWQFWAFQDALDRDRGYKGKKPKKSSKKARRGGKKSKKKKEKDLTPDRTTESLFEELVANGIIKK